MANRKTPFVTGEYYHVYNRGIDKRNIFSNQKDLGRFFQSMIEFNTFEPIGSLHENSFHLSDTQLGGETAKSAKSGNSKNKLINIVAYCLNPNHFHFILEQLIPGGISEFMKRLGGGYTWYFNNKNKRSGSLFQGVFKSIHVDTNEYLLHLSAYVNLNDRVHQLGGETAKLVKSRSSWDEYVGNKEKVGSICTKGIILEQFKNTSEYKEFALSSLKTIRDKKEGLKDINKFLLE